MIATILKIAIVFMFVKLGSDVIRMIWLIVHTSDKSRRRFALMTIIISTVGQLGIIGCLTFLYYGRVWAGIIVLVLGYVGNVTIHALWNVISEQTNRSTGENIRFLDP